MKTDKHAQAGDGPSLPPPRLRDQAAKAMASPPQASADDASSVIDTPLTGPSLTAVPFQEHDPASLVPVDSEEGYGNEQRTMASRIPKHSRKRKHKVVDSGANPDAVRSALSAALHGGREYAWARSTAPVASATTITSPAPTQPPHHAADVPNGTVFEALYMPDLPVDRTEMSKPSHTPATPPPPVPIPTPSRDPVISSVSQPKAAKPKKKKRQQAPAAWLEELSLPGTPAPSSAPKLIGKPRPWRREPLMLPTLSGHTMKVSVWRRAETTTPAAATSSKPSEQ
ncbi:hypothetical protein HDU85_001891 [Gaertneriomyces sp. JEL0708]|nr:hypothetical protein HDU85_001891 [Gaertneriomyces sp. JEL0708]